MKFKNLIFLIIFILMVAAVIVVPLAVIKPKIDRQLEQRTKTESVEDFIGTYQEEIEDPYLKWKPVEKYDTSRWLEKYELITENIYFSIAYNTNQVNDIQHELLFDLKFKKGYPQHYSLHLLKKAEFLMYSSTHEFQELPRLKSLLTKLAQLGVFHRIEGLPQHIRQHLTELTGYF